MKKVIIYLIIGLLSLSIACDNGFLDTTPWDGFSSILVFNDNKTAEMAINGMYNALARNAFDANFYVFISCLGPEGFGIVRANWGPSHSTGLGTSRDGQVTTVYRNFYRPIIYANEIIAGLENATSITPEVKKSFIGEAKFIRGLCYFYLYNLYGGVVIMDKPTPVSESYFDRSTKEQVVEFVIKDFTDAIENLPVANPGRATKGSAIAMLGKTYLYEKQWEKATSQFEKLLTAPYSYNLVTNFFDNFYWKTQNNSEMVFEIQYAMENGIGSSFDNWYGHRSMRNQGQDYCETSMRVFEYFTHNNGDPIDRSDMPKPSSYVTENAYGVALINWYETRMSTVDKRLHQSSIIPGGTFLGAGDRYHKVYWPYAPYVNSTPPALRTTFTSDALIPVRKFVTLGQENTLNRTECPTNFPVIRFADILLMYAEAKNESTGPSSEIYAAIDRVRNRAGIVPLATLKPGLSKDQLRREIWLERMRELMFEDILYFDVRRWNTAHTNDPIFGLNNDEWDFRYVTKYYTKKFESPREYLWPIPGGEIDINPKMQQNPGW